MSQSNALAYHSRTSMMKKKVFQDCNRLKNSLCPLVILKLYTILKMNVTVKRSSLSVSNIIDEEKSFTRLQ